MALATVALSFLSLSSLTAGGPEAAAEVLKFLIHFLGDMHQPLHLCGPNHGGNDYKVLWDGGVTSVCAPFRPWP